METLNLNQLTLANTLGKLLQSSPGQSVVINNSSDLDHWKWQMNNAGYNSFEWLNEDRLRIVSEKHENWKRLVGESITNNI